MTRMLILTHSPILAYQILAPRPSGALSPSTAHPCISLTMVVTINNGGHCCLDFKLAAPPSVASPQCWPAHSCAQPPRTTSTNNPAYQHEVGQDGDHIHPIKPATLPSIRPLVPPVAPPPKKQPRLLPHHPAHQHKVWQDGDHIQPQLLCQLPGNLLSLNLGT
jgi:hypothetical protein